MRKSRESDVDKVLQFIKDTNRDKIVYVKDIMDSTGFDLLKVDDILLWLARHEGMIMYIPMAHKGEVYILGKGNDFIKNGGYSRQKMYKLISQIASVVGFILICATFYLQCAEHLEKKNATHIQRSDLK
jgi:hypothetical protein